MTVVPAAGQGKTTAATGRPSLAAAYCPSVPQKDAHRDDDGSGEGGPTTPSRVATHKARLQALLLMRCPD